MYPETEVLIKLNPIEIQQVLAIDLDRDPNQAFQFKPFDKTVLVGDRFSDLVDYEV